MYSRDELIQFEAEIAQAFEERKIPGPVHLSGGNEDQLIEIFRDIAPEDWIFSTWRSHYHALLHGIPESMVRAEIMAGRSMNLMFPEYHFFTSAIVGGILPIATGVAAALKRDGSSRKVWCFVGDMAARTGIYHESVDYASRQNLPIQFITEDNGLSCNTPTELVWGDHSSLVTQHYKYTRKPAHCGIGKWVNF